MEKTKEKHECPNIGCRMTLKHQKQRECYLNNCIKPTAPPVETQIKPLCSFCNNFFN